MNRGETRQAADDLREQYGFEDGAFKYWSAIERQKALRHERLSVRAIAGKEDRNEAFRFATTSGGF